MIVTSTGDITANTGIDAVSGPTSGGGNSGSVTVSSTGTITAVNIGIQALSGAAGGALADSGDVTVTNDGAIVAATGIAAQSGAAVGDSGDVTVNSTGAFTVTGTAITAISGGSAGQSGDVQVTNDGDIDAAAGIVAVSGASTGEAQVP